MRARSSRLPLLMAVAIAAAAVALFLLARNGRSEVPPRAPGERPQLMLLTSLPLVFADGFSLEDGGSEALEALETRYRVVPISVADANGLRQGRLLLMAHPLAQPAEALVELDRWVRRGGRVLLLADPKLDWPSERPLGDKLRPPPSFADTGLLAHWGLRLDAPDESGPALRRIGGREVLTASPGALSGHCAISDDGLVARCRIGKGYATVIADADFLNVEQLDGPTSGNLPALLVELATLERDSAGFDATQAYPQGRSKEQE